MKKLRRVTARKRRVKTTKTCRKTIIVRKLLDMLQMVKLFHWSTTSYANHEASDELYERMNERVDRFVEVYMGKDRAHRLSWNDDMHVLHGSDGEAQDKGKNFSETMMNFREFLINLDRCLDPERDADLLNIRDDLIGDVNQFFYLQRLH